MSQRSQHPPELPSRRRRGRSTSPSSAPATSACRSRRRSPKPGRRSCSSTSSPRSSTALNRGESHIEDVASESLAPARRVRRGSRATHRLRRGPGRRRDPDRAADAALAAARARPVVRRGAPGAGSRRSCARARSSCSSRRRTPARRARSSSRSSSEGSGLEAGRGLPPRDVARARRPGPHRLDDEDDAEDRRRDQRRPRTEAAADVYRDAVDTVHTVSTPEAAELTKLLENIFRSVNIALVNELAQLCDRMDIDVWEVVERGGDEAVRVHVRSSPARASAATASRSTRSTSRGRRASTTSPRASSSSPARSTTTCRTSAARSISQALNHGAAEVAVGLADPRCSASPTRPTSATRARRPPRS